MDDKMNLLMLAGIVAIVLVIAGITAKGTYESRSNFSAINLTSNISVSPNGAANFSAVNTQFSIPSCVKFALNYTGMMCLNSSAVPPIVNIYNGTRWTLFNGSKV